MTRYRRRLTAARRRGMRDPSRRHRCRASQSSPRRPVPRRRRRPLDRRWPGLRVSRRCRPVPDCARTRRATLGHVHAHDLVPSHPFQGQQADREHALQPAARIVVDDQRRRRLVRLSRPFRNGGPSFGSSSSTATTVANSSGLGMGWITDSDTSRTWGSRKEPFASTRAAVRVVVDRGAEAIRCLRSGYLPIPLDGLHGQQLVARPLEV